MSRPLPASDPRSAVYDALAVMAVQCTARSPHGVVAAAAPRAALAGAEALGRGGNAYDAVVASALAETVLLPPKCGLAGDLVAMAWPSDRPEPSVLVAVGPAAAGLADAAAGGDLTETGPVSVGVPGAPGGYLTVAKRGRLELAELAAPAIDVARHGFCWSDVCADLGRESVELVSTHNPGGTRYTPGGRPLAAGELVTLPGLASALERLVADGHDFLQGPVGQAMAVKVQAAGGVIRPEDLTPPRPEWTEPVVADVAGHRVYASPAPTHGPSLLEAIAACDPGRPDQLHGAVMAAIERRRRVLADPAGTSMVSAVDAEGTLAVVVHSNSFPRFGSGLVVDDYDLVLSNRAGRGFSSDPSHPNFPAPGRRPATTLHAWGLDRSGGPRLLGGTPGGANQMPWNAQSIHRLLTGASPAEAIVAPRWEWRPTDDGVRLEAGIEPETAAAIGRRAPAVERVGLWRLRSAMQLVGHDGRIATAAVDPRTQGAVIGR